jgi:hypothetical protein
MCRCQKAGVRFEKSLVNSIDHSATESTVSYQGLGLQGKVGTMPHPLAGSWIPFGSAMLISEIISDTHRYRMSFVGNKDVGTIKQILAQSGCLPSSTSLQVGSLCMRLRIRIALCVIAV